MIPRQINAHLWILGNEYFYLYLIRGSAGSALFETGVSATAELVLNQLAALKIHPDYLIVSHPHSDHITGLTFLQNSFPAAKVLIGSGAKEFVNHPKAAASMIAEDRHILRAMNERGFQTNLQAVTGAPSLDRAVVVQDGETLDLGGVTLEFLEARGHSPGNILIHLPGIQTLLVSDSLGNYYPGRGFFPTFFTGLRDYCKTLERLAKLKPCKLGLAHNGFFEKADDSERLFVNARNAAAGVVSYVCHSRKSDEEIAADLFGFFYTDELTVYSPENIKNCCRLLVKRVRDV